MAEDQRDRYSQKLDQPDFIKVMKNNDRLRMEEVLEILERIKTPSAKNIGLDGSRAVWLIAQHNWNYKEAGNLVLKKLRQIYYRDKSQVYYQGIPYLVDRMMVGSHLSRPDNDYLPKQYYGTQGWCRRLDDGSYKFEWYPVKNPKALAGRRKKFGLPQRKPGRCL